MTMKLGIMFRKLGSIIEPSTHREKRALEAEPVDREGEARQRAQQQVEQRGHGRHVEAPAEVPPVRQPLEQQSEVRPEGPAEPQRRRRVEDLGPRVRGEHEGEVQRRDEHQRAERDQRGAGRRGPALNARHASLPAA
jgi:hypothetical protein